MGLYFFIFYILFFFPGELSWIVKGRLDVGVGVVMGVGVGWK